MRIKFIIIKLQIKRIIILTKKIIILIQKLFLISKLKIIIIILKKNYIYNNIDSSDNFDNYSVINDKRRIKILFRKIRTLSYIKKKVIKFKFNKIIIYYY